MPWLEERTLILFVRDTEIRRYEPGVREGRVHVEGRSSCSCTSGTCRTLSLERRRHGVVHRHRLVGQHDATRYTSLKQHKNGLSLLQSLRGLQGSHCNVQLMTRCAAVACRVLTLLILFSSVIKIPGNSSLKVYRKCILWQG
jgi:hypothetical protein